MAVARSLLTVLLAATILVLSGFRAAGLEGELIETKLTAEAIPGQGDWYGHCGAISGDSVLVSQRLGGTGNIGGAHVFVRDELGAWSYRVNLADNLEPGVVVAGGEFGSGVALFGDTAIVAAYRNTVDGFTRAGNAFVFTHDVDDTWTTQAELLAPDGPAANARFGAAADLDGDRAILTAAGADKAYIFTRTDSTWDLGIELTGGMIDDPIGAAINGDVAAIGTFAGTPHADIWRYNLETETWNHEAQIANPGGDNLFGTAVDISGETMIISARDEIVDEIHGAGAAYIYRYDGSAWELEETIENPEPASDDAFGYSVAIDGDTVIIGTPRDDDSGADSGAAYIYERSDSAWTMVEKIVASDGAESKWYGQIVDIDGERFLAAGPGRTTDPAGNGDAYVYEVDDGSTPPPEIPGDANGDGKVTDADAAILATNWQTQSGASWEDGDFNGDGKVTDADAAILATHWQEGVTEGATSVPEPALAVLLAGALLPLLLLWWKRDRGL